MRGSKRHAALSQHILVPYSGSLIIKWVLTCKCYQLPYYEYSTIPICVHYPTMVRFLLLLLLLHQSNDYKANGWQSCTKSLYQTSSCDYNTNNIIPTLFFYSFTHFWRLKFGNWQNLILSGNNSPFVSKHLMLVFLVPCSFQGAISIGQLLLLQAATAASATVHFRGGEIGLEYARLGRD